MGLDFYLGFLKGLEADGENMKTTQEQNSTIKTETVLNMEVSSVVSSQLVYNELNDYPVQEADLFEQLENNLAQLEDIRHRMTFMMREIRYLMKI